MSVTRTGRDRYAIEYIEHLQRPAELAQKASARAREEMKQEKCDWPKLILLLVASCY